MISRPSPKTESSPNELSTMQAINLGRHNEIALGQAIDLVRPQRDLRLAPRQQNIRMMTLFLGQIPYSVHKLQSLFEIRKTKLAMNVMFLFNRPLGSLAMQLFQFFSRQWRNPAPAGNALLIGKLFAHKSLRIGQTLRSRPYAVNLRVRVGLPEVAARPSF